MGTGRIQKDCRQNLALYFTQLDQEIFPLYFHYLFQRCEAGLS
jgi:hypothetical protein